MRKLGIHRKPRMSALAIAVQAVLGLPAWAMPQGATVVHGQVGITQPAPGHLQVTAGNGAIINWQRFSIGPGELARFVQPSAQSAVLNRVTGTEASQLLGQLQANGRVFLINPHGIVVGSGARIDTNSFVASTLDIADADFLAGRMRFMAGTVAGEIRNEGLITAGPGGMVALIAPSIVNSGIIHAPDGQILLAAGRSIEIASTDRADVRFEVQAPTDSVLNLGKLIAENGAISAFAATLRNAGEIRADRLVQGADGAVSLVASRDLTLAAGSITTANGIAGGNVRVQSLAGTTRIGGTIEARGATGGGGSVQVLGDRIALEGGSIIDASGRFGGGQVLVGGDYQGANAQVPNARRVSVAEGAALRADATEQGNGGRVIVWADENTRFGGTLSARGGAQSGNGGFAEVSGKQNLAFTGSADLRAPRGALGTLLLDPMDIVVAIGSGILPTVTDEFADFSMNVVTISPETLNALAANVELQASRHVFVKDVLTLGTPGAGLRILAGGATHANGRIHLEDDIHTAGGSVTLRAQGIENQGAIHTNGGAVDIQTTGDLSYSGPISSGGGNVSLSSVGGGVYGTQVTAAGGSIDVSGKDAVYGGRFETIGSGNVSISASNGSIDTHQIAANTVNLQAAQGITASVSAGDRIDATAAGSIALHSRGEQALRIGTVSGQGVSLTSNTGIAQASGGSIATQSLAIHTQGSGEVGSASDPLQLVSTEVRGSVAPIDVSMNLSAAAHLRVGDTSKLNSLSMAGTVASLGASTLTGGANLGAFNFANDGGTLRLSGSTLLGFRGDFAVRVTDGGVHATSLDIQEGGATITAAGGVRLDDVTVGRASGGTWDPALMVQAGSCSYYAANCEAISPITLGTVSATAGHVRLVTTDNGNVTANRIDAASLSIDAGGPQYDYSWGQSQNEIDLASVTTTGAVSINHYGNGNVTLGALDAGGAVNLQVGRVNPYDPAQRTSNTVTVNNTADALRSGGFTIHNAGVGDVTLIGGLNRSGAINVAAAEGNITAMGQLTSQASVVLNAITGAVNTGSVTSGGAVSLTGEDGVTFDRLRSQQGGITLRSSQGSVISRLTTETEGTPELWASTDVIVEAFGGSIGTAAPTNHLDIRSNFSRGISLSASGDIGTVGNSVRVDTSRSVAVQSTGGEFHVEAVDLLFGAGERTVQTIELAASAAGVGAGGSSTFRSGGLDVTATSNGDVLQVGPLATTQSLAKFAFDGLEGGLAVGDIDFSGATGTRHLELRAQGGLVQAPGGNIAAGNVVLQGDAGVNVGSVTATGSATYNGVDIASSAGHVTTGDLSGRQVRVAGGDLSLGAVTSTGTYRTLYGTSEQLSLAARGKLTTTGDVTSATSATLTAGGDVSLNAGSGALRGGTMSSNWEGTDTVTVAAARLDAGDVSGHTIDLNIAGQAMLGNVSAVGNIGFDGGTIAATSLHAAGDLGITTAGAFDAGLMQMTANRAFISAGGDLTIDGRAPLAANEVTLVTRAGSGGHIGAQLDRRNVNDSATYAPTRLTIEADARFNVDAAHTQLTDLGITARFVPATTGGDSRVRTATTFIGDLGATTQAFTLSNANGATISASSSTPLQSIVDPLTPWNIRYDDVSTTAPTGPVDLGAYHAQAGSLDVSFASDTALNVNASMGALLPLGIAGQPSNMRFVTGGALTLNDVQTHGGSLTARSRNGDVMLDRIDVRGSDRSGDVSITSDTQNIVQGGFGTIALGQTLDPTAAGGSVTLSAANGGIVGTAGVASLTDGISLQALPSDPAPLMITNASALNLSARNDLYVQADGAPLGALSIDTTVDGTGTLSVVNNGTSLSSAFQNLEITRSTGTDELLLAGITSGAVPASFSLTSNGGIRVDSSLTGLNNLTLAAQGGNLTIDATGAGTSRSILATGNVSLSASDKLAIRSGGVGEAQSLTVGGNLSMSAGGDMDIVANGALVEVTSGTTGGSSHSLVAGGDITVRGGSGASAYVQVEARSGNQSVSASSLRIEGGAGTGAFAAIQHVPTGGAGTQTVSLTGDLVVQGGHATNQGSGASALLAGHTQSFESIGGRVLVAGGSAQGNTASITAVAGQYIGNTSYGDATDSVTVQGGTATGSFARVVAGGDQTVKAAHDEANPTAATGDIRALGGTGLNASAEIRSGGFQTIGQTNSDSYYYKPTRNIEVVGGAGDGATASIVSTGPSQAVAGGGTIKLIGGSGTNAGATVVSAGSQGIGNASSYAADATDHVIVQGGTGAGASATISASANQNIEAGQSITVAGGAQNAYALIRSDSGQQTIGSDRGSWWVDGTDIVTLSGGAAGASARIEAGGNQTVQTVSSLSLDGGTGSGSNAALVAATQQTVSAWGDISVTGGTDGGTGAAATGIVLQGSGIQSVTADGNIHLTGGTGATDVGILHLDTTGTQVVVAQGDIQLSAPNGSTGVVAIDTSAGAQSVTAGGKLVLDNQRAAAVRIRTTAGQQTIEAQSLSIALAGTQANAFAGLQTAAGFDQSISLLGDGSTRGTASVGIRNTSTGSGSVAGIQSGGALRLQASDDNYDSAGLVKIGDAADTGRSEISAATDLELVAGELQIQGGATADADAALNAANQMNVSVLYGATTLQGGAAGSASIDPAVLNVVSNGSVSLQGGATIGATSTITAGTFNLAATGGSLVLASNASEAAINAGIFNFMGPNTVTLSGGIITVTDSGSIVIDGQCLNCSAPNLIGDFTILSYVPPPVVPTVPAPTVPTVPATPLPGDPGVPVPPQGAPNAPVFDFVTPVTHHVVSLADAYGNSYELLKLEDGTVMVTGGKRNLCQ